ncbi:MAG: hypothetical protein KAV87_53170 [Desulfobacteraceae bacterium]|nr:hypothetical protein [Desulfobacteraceae bacterium]
MKTKEIPVVCAMEHSVVGKLIVNPGTYRLTSSNFVTMFTPVDQGHRLKRSSQRDGNFARCSCGGVLSINPDVVEFVAKDNRKSDGRVLGKDEARNIAYQIAQSTGPVHKHIENRDEGGSTPVILNNTKIRVS